MCCLKVPMPTDLVLTSRFAAVASGRPVIASVRTGTRDQRDRLGVGLVVQPPKNGVELARAIIQTPDNPKPRFQWGRRARSFERRFERDAVLNTMLRG